MLLHDIVKRNKGAITNLSVVGIVGMGFVTIRTWKSSRCEAVMRYERLGVLISEKPDQ